MPRLLNDTNFLDEFLVLIISYSNVPFDFAPGGEPVEPFRISILEFRICNFLFSGRLWSCKLRILLMGHNTRWGSGVIGNAIARSLRAQDGTMTGKTIVSDHTHRRSRYAGGAGLSSTK
jgi:hypothetical protein